MDIKRSGSQPSGKGPAEYLPARCALTLCSRQMIRRARSAQVLRLSPGARTAWHTHPLGQTLIVTAGCGLAQGWGGPTEQIRPSSRRSRRCGSFHRTCGIG
jgi:hypothetical protein